MGNELTSCIHVPSAGPWRFPWTTCCCWHMCRTDLSRRFFFVRHARLQARAIEESFVGRWQRSGVQPPQHPLVASAAAAAAFLRHPDEWS